MPLSEVFSPGWFVLLHFHTVESKSRICLNFLYFEFLYSPLQIDKHCDAQLIICFFIIMNAPLVPVPEGLIYSQVLLLFAFQVESTSDPAISARSVSLGSSHTLAP